MVIITLLTPVRKEKNGKTNFRPGIEPGTSLWVPGSMPGRKFIIPFFSSPVSTE